MDIAELREKILALAKKTIEIVEYEKAHNNLVFANYEYTKFRVTEFKYDDSGTHIRGADEFLYHPFLQNLPKLLEIVFNSDEYSQLDNFIKENLPKEKNESEKISFFIQRIIRKYSETFAISQPEIQKITDGFILDLTEAISVSGAIVQIVGLILQPDEIVLEDGVKLRKPKKEDFETERPVFHPLHEPHYPIATAFLEFSIETNNPMVIEIAIEKTIALMQLFGVGSIRYTKYRQFSSSLFSLIGGTIGCGEVNYPTYIYIIEDEESKKFQHFYRALSNRLPQKMFQLGGQDKDYQSIAFDRYEDALIRTEIDERKITNVMMGLEALYFKEDERLELDYRLQMRMAKVLGKISYDPILVKKAIKDAYKIRSIFSHGSIVDTKKKESYRKKYEEIEGGLVKLVIDFLRVSLIISISIDMKKATWIDLIDNALVRQSFDNELDSVLSESKKIIEKSKSASRGSLCQN